MQDLLETGAFALYKEDMGYRVKELSKSPDADSRIAADFQVYREKYLRKFQDIFTALEQEGLKVERTAA